MRSWRDIDSCCPVISDSYMSCHLGLTYAPHEQSKSSWTVKKNLSELPEKFVLGKILYGPYREDVLERILYWPGRDSRADTSRTVSLLIVAVHANNICKAWQFVPEPVMARPVVFTAEVCARTLIEYHRVLIQLPQVCKVLTQTVGSESASSSAQ